MRGSKIKERVGSAQPEVMDMRCIVDIPTLCIIFRQLGMKRKFNHVFSQ
jgi:hypothetical protein